MIVLLLLLPGVLFFVGLYMPEKFTRETTERSALGHVSAVIVVSLLAHAVMLFITRQLPASWPSVDFAALIQTITLEKHPDNARISVATMLENYLWWILAYLLSAASAGVLLGYLFGKFVAQRMRGLTPHPWVFDLRVGDNYTIAYVLTNVKDGDRVLLYHGFLKWFALKKDGTFAYIVLTEATRSYLILDKDAPLTQPLSKHRMIGGSSQAPKSIVGTRRGHSRSYFVIEGEDIANAVFERFDVASFKVSPREFDKVVSDALQKRGAAATKTAMGKKNASKTRK